jgi:hypothetical protein
MLFSFDTVHTNCFMNVVCAVLYMPITGLQQISEPPLTQPVLGHRGVQPGGGAQPHHRLVAAYSITYIFPS